MILLIDNYDSFVYNLARYVTELGYTAQVYRNDQITVPDIELLQPECIILSPGPCSPNEAGVSLQTVKHFSGRMPILGVCLGHQVIAQAFGATIGLAHEPRHGKVSWISHDQTNLFTELPQPLCATRYHSLIVNQTGFPHHQLQVTAWSAQKEIMALKHHQWPVFGVQFHPESVLTHAGYQLLDNFLQLRVRHEAVA